MIEVLHRSAPMGDTTGRTVHGTVVPYGEIATVRDFPSGRSYRERFQMGAFARSIEQRGHKIRLLIQHSERSLPVGQAVELTEVSTGLRAVFLISDTTAGNDALTLIRDGIIDSFSIGFSPIRDHIDSDGVVVRTEAAMREVSLVTTSPAYSKALIAGVRTQDVPVIDIDSARRIFAIEFEM
ncbi:HK97 family phage prohead protease [Nocardia sp. NPDC059180]|uniref:HK97 family phage prohead protease n=1 Tax=Nocardia sp. NPDC059180 TaxID=3346761 RepID=UPI0036C5F59E